jgi:hypothetical protein
MGFRKEHGRFVCNDCNEWSCTIDDSSGRARSGHSGRCQKKKKKRKITIRQTLINPRTERPAEYNPVYYGGIRAEDDVTINNINDNQHLATLMRREDMNDFEEIQLGLDEENLDIFENGITYSYEIDKKYLEFQKRISDRVFVNKPLQVGQVYNNSTNSVGQACWQDYVELYDLCMRTGISETDCDQVIEKFSKMNARRGVGLFMPKTFKAIKTAIEKTIDEDYSIRSVDVLLNSDFFGKEGVIGATGYALSIMETLSEMLLGIDVKDFHFTPLRETNSSGEKVISVPASGAAFEHIFETVQESFGTDVFPLCYVISGDDLILNKTGSRKAKPWYVQIANMGKDNYNKDASVQCIGFSPLSHFTDDELHSMLSPQIKAEGKRGEVLKWCRHSGEYQFVDTILSDTLVYSRSSRHVVSLQVGRNPKDIFKFIVMLYAIIADNKEANMLSGIQCACRCNRKCRACNVLTSDILDFSTVSESRDASGIEYLGKRG